MESADDDDNSSAFRVFPANWAALCTFLRIARYNTWARAGMSGAPTNLEPAVVERVLAMQGHGGDLDRFDQVMTIGAAAAGELRERFFRH